MRKKLFLTLCALLSAAVSLACTTAIVSGKMTADGRPLMFKTADGSAETLYNVLKNLNLE